MTTIGLGKGGKGLGKGTSRKVLKDNIKGIKNPVIARLARRAGVKRINPLIYENVRAYLEEYLKNILKDVVIFTKNDRRKTIMIRDLQSAIKNKNKYIISGPKIPSCSSESKINPKRNKKRRADPGERSLTEIRFAQNNSDCLMIPHLPFKRLVKEYLQDYHDNIRISNDFINLLQLVVEEYLVKLMANSNMAAIHAKRQTVTPKDFELARDILNENVY